MPGPRDTDPAATVTAMVAPTATATAAAAATASQTRPSGEVDAPPSWRREPLPDRIGRWRVVDRLGRGGMGEVFRVVDDDGAVAALKRARTTRGAYLRALRREIEALAALTGTGIARLIDQGEVDGCPWYAMAFVDGATLDAWARPRPLADRLPVLVELCLILDRLHRAGGVHRDVKPANVLVEGGAPVLVDFGLLIRIGGGRGQPGWARDAVHGAPDRAGTAGYRAPEQRRGQWCDGRTDLYAIGRILADWLAETGQGSTALIALAEDLLADDPADRPRDGITAARCLARAAELPLPAIDADGTALNRAPSVGRHAEIGQLDRALERARAGRGGVIVLQGPSGIGKTRLALEVVRRADGFRPVVGECRPVGDGLLQGIDDLIRFAADRCRGDAARTLAILGAHGPWLSPFVPAVAALPGQTAGLPAPAAARVAEAVAHVARSLAAERPLLLVIDDVQWAARLTALAFERLAADPGAALVLLTARSDLPQPALDGLRRADGVTWLTLGPLEPADAGALVGGLLGERDPDPALVAEIIHRADGNPFFVAECLRSMITDGRLRADGARWRFTGHRSTTSLPGAAEAVIRSRLSRLSAPARALIGALAVLGRRAPLDRLTPLLQGPPEPAAIDEVISRAVCAATDGGLAFAHDRLRQVTLDAIAPETRRALHRCAADDLEARPEPDPYGDARARAFHHDGAGEPARAGRALAEAGRIAESKGALEDAAQCFADAAARGSGVSAVRAAVDRGRVLAAAGRYADAAAVHAAAADAARALGADDLEARARSAMGLSLVLVDRIDEAEGALRRAIALFAALGDGSGQATACSRLATVHLHRGQFDAAEAMQRQALALTDEADALGMARTLNNLAMVADTRGQHAAARVEVTRALDYARRAGRPAMVIGVRLFRAQVLHRAGDLDQAAAELDASIADLDAAGMTTQLGWALVGRATLARHRGPDPAPGWADLERAAAIFADVDFATCNATLAIERGHHHLAEGRDARHDIDDARREAARAGVTPETDSITGRALAGLIAAQACFEAGGALLRGQLRSRIFPGVQAWLDAHPR